MKLCKISNERKRMAVFFFVFLILYTVSFAVLEQRVVPMNMMMCELDALIPFSEFFVIPYFFWFLYLVLTVGYFLLFCSDDSEVKSLLKSFMAGMSVFLFVSLVFPNGHTLRPVLRTEGFCMSLVEFLYSIDTPTNVFPSMHVFLSICCAAALLRQRNLTEKKGFSFSVVIVSGLIVLSTCFLKQHSIIDVIGAFVLNGICWLLFYPHELKMNSLFYRRKKCAAE